MQVVTISVGDIHSMVTFSAVELGFLLIHSGLYDLGKSNTKTALEAIIWLLFKLLFFLAGHRVVCFRMVDHSRKRLLQYEHSYGMAPVCKVLCSLKLDEAANRLSHTSHLNGFSPVCTRL